MSVGQMLLVPLMLGLAGCASMTGLDGQGGFSCKAPDGISCASLSGVYANAVQNNLPGQRPAVKPGNALNAQARIDAMAPRSGDPLRSAQTVRRVWLAPWEDDDEVLHDQGSGWQVVQPGTPRALYDVAAVAAGDAWAVGTGGTVLHWKGNPASWELVDVKSLAWLRGVAVTSTGGWIVGEKGALFALINQTSWIATPSNTSATLNDVWIASGSDAWAVGENGTLMHWNGTAWAPYPITNEAGPVPTLRAVWGADAKDVWAVGVNGTVARYDGSSWSVTRSGEGYSLNDIWGSSASDVYAVGSDGKVLHFDGSVWTEQDTAVGETLNAVWGPDAKNVFIAGEGGALLRQSK